MKNVQIKAYDIVVVVPTYNSSRFLAETLDSLVAQVYSGDFLIFISDDCSQDNTPEIIKSYSKKYPNLIKYRVNETNLGIARNIFSAYRVFPSKYIFTFSGDDYLIDKRFLQKQFDILEKNSSISISFFDGFKFYNNDINTRTDQLRFTPIEGEFDMEYWASNRFFTFNTQAMVFRLSSLPDFEEWMFSCEQEDWLLIFLLLSNGNAFFSKEKVSMYRVHEFNYTNSGNKYKKVKGGLELIYNLNSYSNQKYKKMFGSNWWRYERLFFACLEESRKIEAFISFFKVIFSSTSLKNKLTFIKSIYRKYFKNIEPSY